jgi:transposase
MASLYKQKVGGRDYWYIREMARVNGKPTAINTIYLGTVNNIIRMATCGNAEISKIQSSSFGALWLAEQIEKSFNLVDSIDAFFKHDKKNGPTVGEYFLYAVLNRMVDAVSKEALPEWYANTAIQFIRPFRDLKLLDSRNFWRAWEKVDEETLRNIAATFFSKVGAFLKSTADCMLFDTTNFYTFMDSKTDSELAKRGKNKQGRDWLRQIGLALLVDRGTKLPLYYKEYEGNCHDSKLFGRIMEDILKAMERYGRQDVTIVVDKGMNAEENFAAIDATEGMGFITTYSPYNEERLIHVAMKKFEPVNTVRNKELAQRGLADDRILAWRTEGEYWGAKRLVIVTYNPVSATKQRYAFDQKLVRLGSLLQEIKAKVNRNAQGWRNEQTIRERIAGECKERHLREELYDIRFENTPNGLRMFCHKNDYQIRRRLDWLGKNIIITSRTDWSTEEVVQSSLDRYIVEESFRKAKHDRLVSVNPIRHWTDPKIRCHILTCVMAEVLLRLMEMKLADAGQYHTADVIMRSMHELHSSLCWVSGLPNPQRLIDEPNALQSSILAAFGYTITDGKLVHLDGTAANAAKKPGRPKGSKNKAKEELLPKKHRGRPPKYLLTKASSKKPDVDTL